MIARRWVAMIVFACFASVAGGFAPTARAEGSPKDSSSAKSSDTGKKTAAKARKRRKPVREGDTDENGVVYSK
jgi:hypothetical protein